LLDYLWQELNRKSLNYNNNLINFFQNLQQLHKSFELANQKLNENEELVFKINSVNEIESDKLAGELEKVKNFQLHFSSYQPLIDDMCTQFANINQELHNCGSIVKNQNSFNTKLDDINLRWSNLQNQLQEKYLHMYSLIESSGANIFIKLAESVQYPWERGISPTNKVPYYIK
jgi:chromosome segregation ATPase